MAMDQAQGPLPSSTPLERDARLVSTDHRVAPSEIAIGVIIGRAAEYFDFFVFAIASRGGVSQGVLSLRGARDGDALRLRHVLAGLYRPADRLDHLHGGRPPTWPWRQADDRAVSARLLHHGHVVPAKLRADRRLVAVPSRPSCGSDRALPSAARGTGSLRFSRLTRRSSAAASTPRSHNSAHRSASWWPSVLFSSSCSTFGVRLPRLGLALPLLLRLRH